jgi:rare lipoprotein A
MKRLVVALGLAVIAAAAQAQSTDERVLHPSHDNPSLATALRSWLASKTADQKTAERTPSTRQAATETRPHRRYRYHAHHYRVPETAEPKSARMAPPTVPTLASAPPVAPVESPPAVTAPIMTPVPVVSVAPSAPAEVPVGATTAPAPMTVSVAPTAPAPEPIPAPANLILPRPVATITVTAPRPSAPRPRHGGSQCTTGEKIVTAFYWEGKYTATGARFNPEGLTAAHRTFPFGTKLLVINPRNGKSVTVTINDRGPFTRGVSLDLSRGAAKAIGLQGNAVVCMAKM